MIPRSTPLSLNNVFRRYISHQSKKGSKRFMQTIPLTNKAISPDFYSGLNYSISSKDASQSSGFKSSKWSRHSLTFPASELPGEQSEELVKSAAPVRRSRTSRFPKPAVQEDAPESIAPTDASPEAPTPVVAAATTTTPASQTPKKKRRQLRPRKALITLSANAVEHLKGLLDQPEPQLIRIGVKNRGCSGLTYHLEYVSEPGKFDETVEQDGVKVLIDSKALFSIVGSEMDWLDDKLSSRFVFKNPNSKGTCGCGESFMV